VNLQFDIIFPMLAQNSL